MTNAKIIHIVRRYGVVGGMEGYVWELTHALADLGSKVEVICERCYGKPSANIQVHTVTPDKSASRWRAMLGFRARVDSLIVEKFLDRTIIIHSHERTHRHHITTFHGPPMQTKNNWWRFSWFSPRIKAWKLMEKDEILGPRVRFVLPVSNRIKEHLTSAYPDIQNKNIVIAYPGIHEALVKKPGDIKKTEAGVRFVFIGKEWKRKGLKFAVELIEKYASLVGPCTMDVYGPDPPDLPRFIRRHVNLNIKGWSKEICWTNYDALIHPATNEPFGMVIPEARAHGVPVLTTTVVGSTELNYRGVIALKPTDNVEIWTSNLAYLLSDDRNKTSEIKWTWRQLALKHLHEIYPIANQPLT